MKNITRQNSSQSNMMKDWEDFKAGRIKLRTWHIDPETNKRTMSFKGIEDLRKEKADKIKEIRAKKLKMSQSQLAKAIHVSPRTLQGWEIGRSTIPEPVIILIQLMRDQPEIKRKLVKAA
jgi:DNA-binding transcriptional regulator YiaG